MKIIERQILAHQENDFFTPIRNKIDYARILALGSRALMINPIEGSDSSQCKIKLVIDKMSRLFFFKDKKYFSIAFPFPVIIEGSEVVDISTYSGKKIDNEGISAIISILDSDEFRLNPSLIDFYIEPFGLDYKGVFLLEEIFQFEPAYIRYDFDMDRANGKLHPEHHLDVNYSQNSTFKLGLNHTITQDYFENIQNTRTDCCFLID